MHVRLWTRSNFNIYVTIGMHHVPAGEKPKIDKPLQGNFIMGENRLGENGKPGILLGKTLIL